MRPRICGLHNASRPPSGFQSALPPTAAAPPVSGPRGNHPRGTPTGLTPLTFSRLLSPAFSRLLSSLLTSLVNSLHTPLAFLSPAFSRGWPAVGVSRHLTSRHVISQAIPRHLTSHPTSPHKATKPSHKAITSSHKAITSSHNPAIEPSHEKPLTCHPHVPHTHTLCHPHPPPL